MHSAAVKGWRAARRGRTTRAPTPSSAPAAAEGGRGGVLDGAPDADLRAEGLGAPHAEPSTTPSAASTWTSKTVQARVLLIFCCGLMVASVCPGLMFSLSPRSSCSPSIHAQSISLRSARTSATRTTRASASSVPRRCPPQKNTPRRRGRGQSRRPKSRASATKGSVDVDGAAFRSLQDSAGGPRVRTDHVCGSGRQNRGCACGRVQVGGRRATRCSTTPAANASTWIANVATRSEKRCLSTRTSSARPQAVPARAAVPPAGLQDERRPNGRSHGQGKRRPVFSERDHAGTSLRRFLLLHHGAHGGDDVDFCQHRTQEV